MKISQILKSLVPHLIAAAVFLGVNVIYFYPQIQGKKIEQHDINMWKGMSQEIMEYNETHDDVALWTNSMFGGMPTYQISLSTPNLLKPLASFIRLGFKSPIGLIFSVMICFYFMLIVMKVEYLTAIICSIAFGLTTNNMVLLSAGHNTKTLSLAFLSIITAGIFLAYKKKPVVGALIFGTGLGLNLLANHPQMTYYFFITLIILGVILIANAVRSNGVSSFLKSTLFLIVAGLLAVGTASTLLWTTYEYSKTSIRGEPILVEQNQENSSSSVEGLDWNYVNQWSNGAIDLAATIIPRVAGGSTGESISTSSNIYREFRRVGLDLGQNPSVGTYWGGKPSTSGPDYFGVVMVFFFLLGLLMKDTSLKWWAGLAVLLTCLLSLGKHFESFTRIFFEYLPFYNKFRAPSSIMGVTSFFIPLLGGLTLSKIVKEEWDSEELWKNTKIAVGILGGVTLFFALIGPSFFSFSSPSDVNYTSQYNINLEAFVKDRKEMMRSDGLRSFGLVAMMAILMWSLYTKKIRTKVFILVVGAFALGDLWLVDQKYLSSSNFSDTAIYDRNFAERPVDSQIKQDPDPHYRVVDFSTSFWQDASASYHHKTIGGYHGAKLQRIQDLYERHLSRNNVAVYSMLNTKYFIIPGQNNQPAVQLNRDAAGNAWFVDTINIVPTPQAEIDGLSGIDVLSTCVVHQEFGDYVARFNPDGQGTINLTSYSPNKLVYSSSSNSDQLAIFSEMWYGPNLGWEATIDGAPVEHIRANYALRALKVPTGQHEIVFEFKPRSVALGSTISLASSGILVVGLLFVLVMGIKDFEAPSKKTIKRKVKVSSKNVKPKSKSRPKANQRNAEQKTKTRKKK